MSLDGSAGVGSRIDRQRLYLWSDRVLVAMSVLGDADMSDDGYEVGYRKPPVASQFKPGQSGNPPGRPRRTKSIPALLDRILDEKVSIKLQGRERRVSKREALAIKLVNDALKGERRQLDIVLRHMQETGRPEPFVCEPIDDAIFAELIATTGNPTNEDAVEPGDAE